MASPFSHLAFSRILICHTFPSSSVCSGSFSGQLREVLETGPLRVGILAVKLEGSPGDHVAGYAHGINMRIDGIHIRRHIVMEDLQPGLFRRGYLSRLALSGGPSAAVVTGSLESPGFFGLLLHRKAGRLPWHMPSLLLILFSSFTHSSFFIAGLLPINNDWRFLTFFPIQV